MSPRTVNIFLLLNMYITWAQIHIRICLSGTSKPMASTVRMGEQIFSAITMPNITLFLSKALLFSMSYRHSMPISRPHFPYNQLLIRRHLHALTKVISDPGAREVQRNLGIWSGLAHTMQSALSTIDMQCAGRTESTQHKQLYYIIFNWPQLLSPLRRLPVGSRNTRDILFFY